METGLAFHTFSAFFINQRLLAFIWHLFQLTEPYKSVRNQKFTFSGKKKFRGLCYKIKKRDFTFLPFSKIQNALTFEPFEISQKFFFLLKAGYLGYQLSTGHLFYELQKQENGEKQPRGLDFDYKISKSNLETKMSTDIAKISSEVSHWPII